MADIVLRELPDVDQTQRRAPVQEFLDFERGYFERDVVHNREFNRRKFPKPFLRVPTSYPLLYCVNSSASAFLSLK